jgi:thioredoxin 1
VDDFGIVNDFAFAAAQGRRFGFHHAVKLLDPLLDSSHVLAQTAHRFQPKANTPMTTHVSDANFGEEVLNSKEPVLVDFWAEWCGPCRAISPLLEELSSELAGKVKIVKLNVDENPGTTVKYGVRSIPTMILFKGGEAADMKIGAGTPKAGLSKWLSSYAA